MNKMVFAIAGLLTIIFGRNAQAQQWGNAPQLTCESSISQAAIEKRGGEAALSHLEKFPLAFETIKAQGIIGITNNAEYFRTIDNDITRFEIQAATKFGIKAGQEMALMHCSPYSGRSLEKAVNTAVENYLRPPQP